MSYADQHSLNHIFNHMLHQLSGAIDISEVVLVDVVCIWSAMTR